MAPASESPGDSGGGASIKTLLLTDLVDSTRLFEQLGDRRAAELFAHHDRIARDLLVDHGGQEIDKTDGFLFLFQRPIAAARCALEYHEATRALSEEYGVQLAARAGIHLGEVVLRENEPDDIARGAKPLEVEGLAKHTVARVMSLALGGQTLMSETAFLIASRAAVGTTRLPIGTCFERHGLYQLKGVEDPIAIGEVGVEGKAPLTPPPDSEKAWHASRTGGIELDAGRPPVPRSRIAAAGVLGGLVGLLAAVWLASRPAPDGRAGGQTAPAPVQPAPVRPAPPPAAPPDPRPLPATPPPPAAPALLELHIESDPAGATIRLDGSAVGSTPLSMSVPATAAAYALQATLPGRLPRKVRCVVSQADVSRGKSLCTLALRPRPRARPRPERPRPRPAGGKPEEVEDKPKIHMID